MKKFRSTLTLIGLSLTLAACSAALNACGGQQGGGEVSAFADRDTVFIVGEDGSNALAAQQQAVLSVGEGVNVDEDGRAILQFADLLTVEVLRDGELTVQELSVDEQNAAITIFQNGGLLINDFNAEEAVEKRFTISTEFATIEATGTTFMVYQEPNSPLQWVLALSATPNDLEVTSTESGTTKDVQSNVARWIAPIGEPSAGISANMASVEAWLQQSQDGTNTENFGEIVWPQADVEGDFGQITAAAPVVIPAPGVNYTYQGVSITLGNSGQYTSQDCNLDGISDIAMVNGSLEMDFRQVLARVRALDVTVLVESGTGKLTVLDPARQTIQTQSALASPSQAQVMTTRDTVPYHYAELTLDEGCFLGFSLTPPTPSGQPDSPRPAVDQMAVAEHFVRIDVPFDGASVTDPLIVSGVASVPEFNDQQLLLRIETPDGQQIQSQWVSVSGELGGDPGTFYTTLPIDYILPAEVVVRVQNIWPIEIPVVLAEDSVRITLNPETTGTFRRPPENGEFFAPYVPTVPGIAASVGGIVMDGDLTDWQVVMRASGVSPTPIDAIVYNPACDAFNPYGIPSSDALVDLAGQVMFAYDENYLYTLFIVQDESYAPYRGEDNRLFLGDAPQLILDTDLAGDFEDTTDSQDDIEFDFHPGYADSSGDDVGPAYFLYSPHAAYWNLGDLGTRDASRPAHEVVMATWLNFDGYTLEAAIPWASLNVSGLPGGVIGVAASISDNDDTDVDAQQCMISSAPQRDYTNPTTWGTLFLMALP